MTEEELKLRARARLRVQEQSQQSPPPASPDEVSAEDFGDTKGNVLYQALGGAKHAWDRAAAGLESLVPGGRMLSKALDQPDLQQLKKQGSKFVEETGPASTVGELGGELLLTAAPATRAVQLAGRTASIFPRALTRTRALLIPGAAAGAAGAATMGDDIVQGAEIGAALNPALRVAGRLANAGVSGLQNITGGAAGRAVKELQDMFGDRTAQAIAALRGLRPEFAGDLPTGGQAATAALPELKAIEESALRRPGAHQLLRRRASTEQAREGMLEQMAEPGMARFNPQTGRTELPEAVQRRAAVTDPLMEWARAQRVDVTPELEAILAGPEAQAALRRGSDSFRQGRLGAAGRGEPFPAGREAGVPPAPPREPFFGEGGQGGQPYRADDPFMPRAANYSIDELWRVRKNIDEQLRRLRNSSDITADNQIRQLTDARQQLTAAMRQSGEFNLANDIFRNYSAPINQSQIAAELLRSLRSPTGATRLSSYLGAIENAPQTIKRADLSPRFQNIGEVMTPEQMADINAITRSVRREADYANLGAKSGIAPKEPGTLEKVESALPPVFSKEVTTLRKALRWLSLRSDEQMFKVIDSAIADPAKMAELLSRVPPDQRSSLVNAIRRIASNPATLPATVGTLSANEGAE